MLISKSQTKTRLNDIFYLESKVKSPYYIDFSCTQGITTSFALSLRIVGPLQIFY